MGLVSPSLEFKLEEILLWQVGVNHISALPIFAG